MNEDRETETDICDVLDVGVPGCRADRAQHLVIAGQGGDVVDPVNREPEQWLEAARAVLVLDEPGELHALNLGDQVSDLLGEHVRAEDEDRLRPGADLPTAVAAGGGLKIPLVSGT